MTKTETAKWLTSLATATNVAANFPQEYLYVLKILKVVYTNDALAKDQQMSPEQRLAFHKAQSKPKMDELKAWLAVQIEQRKVEPNSGLGGAITYMRKHWDKLTLFLRHPAARWTTTFVNRP